MGQQKILLIAFLTIILSAAVVVGMNVYAIGSLNSELDALLIDVNSVVGSATSYWRMPVALGGGARSFEGVSDVSSFDSELSNMNSTFVLSSVMTNQFVLTATSANKGIIIVATITQQGVMGSPDITLP